VASVPFSFFFFSKLVFVARIVLLFFTWSAILHNGGLKNNFVDFSDIHHVNVMNLFFFWLGSIFLIFIRFSFNFDFVLISFLLSLKFLSIIIVIGKPEEILNGLTFSYWRRQICKTVSQKDAIASIMQNIFSNHLWQWLLLRFLLINLSYFH